MHYYNFNIAAYRAKTAHLNIIEHGIYRQLMDWYYLDEMPIPLETQVVMRRLCLGSDNLHNLENVLTDFFIKTDLGYCHSRITRELEHYQAQFAKNRVNGMLGGRPKKTTIEPKKTQVVSENNHMATQINPNQELITNNHKPITNITPIRAIALGFDDFWLAYPKKVGKDAAQKAWLKKKPPIDEVLKAIQWQIDSDQWKRGFIQNPTTYINAGSWKDEPIAEGKPF